jgi:guanine deaminase
MATRGNASLLDLHQEIGSLDIGAYADLVVLDPEATPLLEARQALSESLEDMLFALMILGDDRAVRATYVAGRPVHVRKA